MVESLLVLEKQARIVCFIFIVLDFVKLNLILIVICMKACDAISTARLLVAIVKFCYQKGDLDALNENIHLLSKRRSQLKQVSSLSSN